MALTQFSAPKDTHMFYIYMNNQKKPYKIRFLDAIQAPYGACIA